MFNKSKYTTVYYNIINNALSNPRTGYIERHHIVPKCLGGADSKDNLVALSAREHYICHLLLCKMTEGDAKKKATYAAWTMARTRKIKTNSRIYAALKERATAQLRQLQTGKPRGPQSEEHKAKIRAATIRRYEDPAQRALTAKMSTGKKHSEETKAKMRKSKEGYVPAPTYGMQGKKHSPKTLEKMRLAWLRRKERQLQVTP